MKSLSQEQQWERELAESLLVRELDLTKEQKERYVVFLSELYKKNSQLNLTSIDAKDAVELQIADSLHVARLIRKNGISDGRLIDIGTGCGVPGIPLAIAFENFSVSLLDATQKKLLALNAIAQQCKVNERIQYIHGRAEELGKEIQYRETFKLAVARAVAALPILVELSLPYLSIGGIFIAMKSSDIDSEREEALPIVKKLGGTLKTTVDYAIQGYKRSLIIIEKTAPTPNEFPRPTKKLGRSI